MADVFIGVNIGIEQELEKRQLEIHIKVQKRNGRKSWTFIEGLDKVELPPNKTVDMFLEDICRKLKKSFNCGANVKKPENVIQLMGDHRDNVKQFIINQKIVKEDQIKMHGF